MVLGRVVFLSLLISVSCQGSIYKYDCRRLDDCLNGGTCLTELEDGQDREMLGTCTCATGFEGYNCGIISGTTCPTKTCSNDGTCFLQADGITEVCGCLFGYIGDICEIEIAEISCKGSSVMFDLAFPEVFEGVVKINTDTDPLTSPPVITPTECNFAESAADGRKAYSLTISVKEDSDGVICGAEQLAVEEVEPDVFAYTAAFRIQYLKTLVTNVDQIYNLTCVHDGTTQSVYKEISNVNVNTAGNLSVVAKNKTYNAIQFEIQDSTGQPLAPGSQLFIGDLFILHVFLIDNEVYTDLRIEECRANNTKADADEKTYTFFENGCPTKQGKRSANEQVPQEKETDGQMYNGKKVNIWAFKFVDSDLLGFVCSVKVCKAGDVTCEAPADCEGVRNTPAPTEPPNPAPTEPPAPGLRKKRDAGDEQTETIVSTVISVKGPRDYSLDAQSGEPKDPGLVDCLSQSEIMAVIWVLAAVVFILFVAVIVLSCILINRRNRPKHVFEPPTQYAVRTDRFQLPRAHVNQAYREA